jgi:hypothetical protein
LQLVARIVRDVVPVLVPAVLYGVGLPAGVGEHQVVVRPIVNQGRALCRNLLPAAHSRQAHSHYKGNGKKGQTAIVAARGFHSLVSWLNLGKYCIADF